MRHQQLVPVFSPALKLYSGYAVAHLPDVELHVDTPDTMLPFRNVTDHVFSEVSYELSVPLPDGSKIMAVCL